MSIVLRIMRYPFASTVVFVASSFVAGFASAQDASPQQQVAAAERAVRAAEGSGQDDARLGESLGQLGLAYAAVRNFRDAEPVLLRAAAVKESVYGSDHPDYARGLLDLGTLYRIAGQHAKAEGPIRRAVAILEKALGPEHPEVAGNLTNLGGRLRDQGKFADAEPILKRALAIREKILPPNDPDIVRSRLGVANLYADQGRYAEAEPLFQRAIRVLEELKLHGTGYPNLPDTLRVYADVLRRMGRAADATATEARANQIRPAAAPR
jgi:tetratricopeptide (TPR) repeat protein